MFNEFHKLQTIDERIIYLKGYLKSIEILSSDSDNKTFNIEILRKKSGDLTSNLSTYFQRNDVFYNISKSNFDLEQIQHHINNLFSTHLFRIWRQQIKWGEQDHKEREVMFNQYSKSYEFKYLAPEFINYINQIINSESEILELFIDDKNSWWYDLSAKYFIFELKNGDWLLFHLGISD